MITAWRQSHKLTIGIIGMTKRVSRLQLPGGIFSFFCGVRGGIETVVKGGCALVSVSGHLATRSPSVASNRMLALILTWYLHGRDVGPKHCTCAASVHTSL